MSEYFYTSPNRVRHGSSPTKMEICKIVNNKTVKPLQFCSKVAISEVILLSANRKKKILYLIILTLTLAIDNENNN